MPDKDVQPLATTAFWRPASTRRFPGSPLAWLLVAAVLLAALLSLFGQDGLTEYLRLSHQHERLAAEAGALEQQTAALEADLDALRHDPDALEALARERYNMRRKGEQVIRLVTPEEAAKAP
ncbi:MAG: septum formation initiator family protein [Candidatus Krumholzibacteriia bacterium]